MKLPSGKFAICTCEEFARNYSSLTKVVRYRASPQVFHSEEEAETRLSELKKEKAGVRAEFYAREMLRLRRYFCKVDKEYDLFVDLVDEVMYRAQIVLHLFYAREDLGFEMARISCILNKSDDLAGEIVRFRRILNARDAPEDIQSETERICLLLDAKDKREELAATIARELAIYDAREIKRILRLLRKRKGVMRSRCQGCVMENSLSMIIIENGTEVRPCPLWGRWY